MGQAPVSRTKRPRSPQFPIMGLAEAIYKVKKIYSHEHQASISRKVIAQHMGYKGINGASMKAIATLLRYGLLEGQGDATRVSDLAIAIINYPEGSPERNKAILQAATSPKLFFQIDERSQNGKASDANIKAYLTIELRFIPPAADTAIRAYRETKEFVNNECGDSPSAENQLPTVVEAKQSVENDNQSSHQSASFAGDSPLQNTRKMVFALNEGDVTIHFPENLSPESVEELEGYISIFMKKAKRQAEKYKDLSDSDE